MARWELRFDGGRQHRYLPDRGSVLRYILALGPQAQDTRFEIWAETEPLRLADGSDGGRAFALSQVVDLASPGEHERLSAELAELAATSPPAHASPPGEPS
jgi:hypothetical protein